MSCRVDCYEDEEAEKLLRITTAMSKDRHNHYHVLYIMQTDSSQKGSEYPWNITTTMSRRRNLRTSGNATREIDANSWPQNHLVWLRIGLQSSAQVEESGVQYRPNTRRAICLIGVLFRQIIFIQISRLISDAAPTLLMPDNNGLAKWWVLCFRGKYLCCRSSSF